MKTKIFFLLMSFIINETLYAQYKGDNLFMGSGTVSGPVKKVSVKIKQHHDPSDTLTSIALFDTKGNIVKTGYYKEERFIIDGIYKYSNNNSCLYYQYDENGSVDNNYSKIYFDAKGHELLKFFYWKDKLRRVDSLVYDTQGHLIAKYVSPYMERTPLLNIIYSYDSLGRILEEKNIKEGNHYTILYGENGNYTKQIIKTNGKKYTAKGFINESGQLVKEVIPEEEMTIYYNYDRFGNWLKSESSMNSHSQHGWLGTTIERTIEYYE